VSERLVEEQIAYYDQRAAEYDATSMTCDDPQYEYVEQIEKALADFRPTGKVLEFACGTGNWTSRLQPFADEVLALDSSPQMLEFARTKVSAGNVRFEQADLFAWEPPDAYDVVFFSFWISHVPQERFDEFWELVHCCLTRKGRIFFIDERPHEHWHEEYIDEQLVQRTLQDGSRHRVVKKFWAEGELEQRLRGLGWSVSVTGTGPFFWAEGSRA